MSIEKADFVRWKNDPVTVALFSALNEARDGLNESLLSDEVLLGDTKDRALLVGQRVGLEYILNVSIDEMIGEEQDDSINNPSRSPSGS